MSDVGGGDRISYTTKELLAEIREGITEIKTTTRNHESRILKLEALTSEHEDIRKVYVPKVDALARDLDIQAEVRRALDARADRGFTRREKVAGLLIAVVVLALNIAQLLSQF